MLDVVLAGAGGVALVVGATFVHLERWSITPPLVGLVTGVLLGPRVIGVLDIPPGEDTHVLHLAARLLLAVALMAIALRYPVHVARERIREVTLLLVVVLPLMLLVVAGGALWTLQLPIGAALVLGAALSPTDPVLASGIVTGVPAEHDIPARDRQVLSLESGANDGLALPFVVVTLAVALERPLAGELARSAYEVAAAIGIGALAGAISGWLLRWASEHREIGPAVRSLFTLVLAAFVLGLCGLLHANGLLSVFVAGLLHNHVITGGDRGSEVAIDEALNQFLVLPVFVLLGAVLPWSGWGELGWSGLGFVLVVLFLRRLPAVLLLQRPLGLDRGSASWLGWFGPIGVAALFYLTHAHTEGVADPTFWAAGTLVVAVSTVVHGLSASPARLLSRRREASGPRQTIGS